MSINISILYQVKELEMRKCICFMKALFKQQKVITTRKLFNELTKRYLRSHFVRDP